MEKTIRKIAVVVLGIVIFTVLTISAYAADPVGRGFSREMTFGTYSQLHSYDDKSDTSPMFLEIERNYQATSFYVRAIGCDSSGRNGENVTCYNGQIVDHVHCFSGNVYGVKTLALEHGFHHVTFSLLPCGLSTVVIGLWAPDTIQDYPVAIP